MGEIKNVSDSQAGNMDGLRSLLDQYKDDMRGSEQRLKSIIGDVHQNVGRVEQECLRQVSDMRSEIAASDLGRDQFHSHVTNMEFDKETNRIWSALDTHTHNINTEEKRPIRPATIIPEQLMPPPLVPTVCAGAPDTMIAPLIPGSARVMPGLPSSPRQSLTVMPGGSQVFRRQSGMVEPI